jgi:hypothetical protein
VPIACAVCKTIGERSKTTMPEAMAWAEYSRESVKRGAVCWPLQRWCRESRLASLRICRRIGPRVWTPWPRYARSELSTHQRTAFFQYREAMVDRHEHSHHLVEAPVNVAKAPVDIIKATIRVIQPVAKFINPLVTGPSRSKRCDQNGDHQRQCNLEERLVDHRSYYGRSAPACLARRSRSVSINIT